LEFMFMALSIEKDRKFVKMIHVPIQMQNVFNLQTG